MTNKILNGFQNSSLDFKPIVLLHTPVLNFGSYNIYSFFFLITLVTLKVPILYPQGQLIPQAGRGEKNHINYFQNMTPVTQILQDFMGLDGRQLGFFKKAGNKFGDYKYFNRISILHSILQY